MDTKELLKKAQLLLVDGKDKESIEAFTKAIEAGADPYICHLSRGVVYVKLKESDKALDDLNKAIKANSLSARAYFFRGMTYMMKEDFNHAVADFTGALNLKTNYGMAKFARAVSYARLGNFDEASKDMAEVAPQMEENIQGFADSYGIVRTEMSKVMAQLAGESNLPNLELDDKNMEILKKWLND